MENSNSYQCKFPKMDSSFLMCDEELSSSTPSPSHSTNNIINCVQVSANFTCANAIDAEEYDSALKNYLSKEREFEPLNGYLEKLMASPVFSAARFRAVDWIIKARSRLNLDHGTAFAAVNYADRFFSMNFHINIWEIWMAELIAIACLSIACKFDEVSPPNLHDFQTDDQEHAYEPSTIKSMELKILKVLDYRLVCVTSYSYLDILIHRINSPHLTWKYHTVEFLLRVLLDEKFVRCSPITIAIAALQCTMEKVLPFEYDVNYSKLEQLVPIEHKEKKEKCLLLMEEHIEAPYFYTMSPNAVLTKRRINVSYISVDINGCFVCNDHGEEASALKKPRST